MDRPWLRSVAYEINYSLFITLSLILYLPLKFLRYRSSPFELSSSLKGNYVLLRNTLGRHKPQFFVTVYDSQFGAFFMFLNDISKAPSAALCTFDFQQELL